MLPNSVSATFGSLGKSAEAHHYSVWIVCRVQHIPNVLRWVSALLVHHLLLID